MPKPFLKEPQATLEQQLIETMQAGLHEWRSDLYGPQSYSDYQGCARGLIRMFEIKRRPLPVALEYRDHDYAPHKDAAGNVLCQFCNERPQITFNRVDVCETHYKALKG